MPVAPVVFPSGPVTAKSLNQNLYEYVPGQQFTPNGILFHAQRPMLVEGLSVGTGMTVASSTGGTYTDLDGAGWKNYYDSAALYGGGADALYDAADGTLNPGVPGSSGSAPTAGGLYLTWGFADFAHTVNAGASGAGLDVNASSIVAGGQQLSSTTRENCAYALDMYVSVNGSATNLRAYCADSSGSSFTVTASLDDYSGDLTRFYGMWCGVASGGSAVTAVPSPPPWGAGSAVTAAILNGDAAGNPLALLNSPPALRAGAGLSQSFGAGTTATVGITGKQVDTYSAFSTVTHTWTVPLDGVYLVHGYTYWVSGTTGNIYTGFQVNGSSNYWGPAYQATGAGNTGSEAIRLLDLHAGDTVTLIAFSNNANTTSASFPCRLVSLWLSALAPSDGAWSLSPPAPGYRWQAGTSGADLTAAFQQHLAADLTFLIQRPYLLAWQSSAQTGLAQNAFQVITMDTVAGRVHGTPGDSYGGWTSGSSNKYTAVAGGWYLVCAGYSQAVPGTTPASCLAGISQSPAGAHSPDWYQHVSTTSTVLLPGAEAIGLYYLRAGDSVQPVYQQQDGGSFSTAVAAGHESWFGLVWISE